MLNARNWIPLRSLAMTALVAAFAFNGAIAGDDDDSKTAPVLDLNARLQQKLDAKLNGQINEKEAIPEDRMEGDLSARVNEQQAAAAEELEAQASSLTSAKRGEEDKDKNKNREKAAAESASR